MKIIHTSDWHIGQNFYHYDRDDEHLHFFAQLAVLLARERPDALVVSGDVFHTAAPSAAAQRLFVEGVMWLHDASPDTIIVITAGNHDSGSRLDAERDLWSRLGIHVIGTCRRSEDGTFDPAQFLVTVGDSGYVLAAPYFHPSNYPMATAETDREERQREFYDALLAQVADQERPVVLMAHLAVEGSDTSVHDDVTVGGMLKEELSQLGTGYDYLALGHIHMPQRINDRVRYCGSPIPVSFSEDYTHYVNLVEITAHGQLPTVTQMPIETKRPLRTIPKDGAPLDEALEALALLDPTADCYIRVLVDQEGVIDPDAEDRARQIAEDKRCRFCEVRRKARERHHTAEVTHDMVDLSDFEALNPIDIALRSYERAHQSDMDESLRGMMQQVIDEAQQEANL